MPSFMWALVIICTGNWNGKTASKCWQASNVSLRLKRLVKAFMMVPLGKKFKKIYMYLVALTVVQSAIG